MSSVKDIAALVQIRTYVATIMQNTNAVSKDSYRKLNAKIAEIDSWLIANVQTLDVQTAMAPEVKNCRDCNKPKPSSRMKATKPKTNPKTAKKTTEVEVDKVVDESDLEKEVFGKEDKSPKPEKKSDNKDLSEDEDLALIQKRISEEKEKLSGKKSSAKISRTVDD